MNRRFNQVDRDDGPLILVIDDDPETITLLSHILRSAGYRTISAENASIGIAIARKYRPNIIVLDLKMPGKDGYATCEQLKAQASTSDIPVIFGTCAERTDETIARCFDVGANDFISKPFNRVDLLARIHVVLREQATREAYRRLATEDTSTGLSNRRQFIEHVNEAITAVRGDDPSASEKPEVPGKSSESILILAGIDNLAKANDRFGHEFGDELILTFANLLKRLMSQDCEAGRIGEDDFGLVLTASSRERGLALSERLRRTFGSIVFDAGSAPKHFTASFGLASYDGEPVAFDADAFMRQADTALCGAKQAGRNRVFAYWQLDPKALPKVPPHKRCSRAKPRHPTQRAFIGQPEAESS